MTDTPAERISHPLGSPWVRGYNAGKMSQQDELQWCRAEIERLCIINDDMLAALKGAVELSDTVAAKGCVRNADGTVLREPECQAAYDRCVAAIAKATLMLVGQR